MSVEAGNGQTVFEFLNLGAGARQIAMADTSVALADDAAATHYNAGAIPHLTQNEVTFMDGTLFQDAHYDVLNYVYPDHGNGAFAGEINYLTYGSVNTYDATDAPTGTSTPSDFSLTGGWGQNWAPNWYGGVKAKIVRENLIAATATGFGLDAGILKTAKDSHDPFKWSWGAVLQNLGPNVKLESESEPMPTAFTVGGALHMREEQWLVAADLHQPVKGSTWFSMGSEYWFYDDVALRMGYRTDQSIGTALTGGVGLKVRDYQLDMAVESFGALGMTYRVGFTFRFGGMAEDLYREGIAFMKAKRYAEAIIKFDEVLKLRPDHPGAIRAMRISYDKLRASHEEGVPHE